MVQKLTLKDLDGLVFPTKLAIIYRRQQLLNYVKNTPSIKKLGNAQRNLMILDDLGIIVDDIHGLINLYIEHHGKVRSFDIKGFIPFQTDILVEIIKTIQILNEHILDALSNTTELCKHNNKRTGTWFI